MEPNTMPTLGRAGSTTALALVLLVTFSGTTSALTSGYLPAHPNDGALEIQRNVGVSDCVVESRNSSGPQTYACHKVSVTDGVCYTEWDDDDADADHTDANAKIGRRTCAGELLTHSGPLV